MSLTALERETVITLNDEEELAHVHTSQRPVITKLRKNPAATLLDEGRFEGTAWAEFELPKKLSSFRSGRVKIELTDEQRQVRAARLRGKPPAGDLGIAATA